MPYVAFGDGALPSAAQLDLCVVFVFVYGHVSFVGAYTRFLNYLAAIVTLFFGCNLDGCCPPLRIALASSLEWILGAKTLAAVVNPTGAMPTTLLDEMQEQLQIAGSIKFVSPVVDFGAGVNTAVTL